MVSIRLEPIGKVFKADDGNLLEILRQAGVSIRSDCGGKGICGKCKIVIVEANATFSEISEAERKNLTEEEIKSGYRLACQTTISGKSATIFIPKESKAEVRKISDLYREAKIELKPAIRKFFVKLQKPTLADNSPDYERLARIFGEFEIPLELLRKLPKKLREADWEITATFWKNTLIDIEKGKSEECYGLAVDIGSSKIVCHLVDINSGKTVAKGYEENPQVAYGEDVVSRITYASKDPENLRKLQKAVVDAINGIIAKLCNDAKVEKERIYEAMVVGNAVMHHLFFGIEPKYISVSPFTPAIRKGVSFSAKEIGLDICKQGVVSSLPLIAGFVGADAVANIAITGVHKEDKLSMVIDIGTNTEIILGNKDRLLACSTPSGPAFEGAHMAYGIKAVSGAIDSVRIFDDRVEYSTIDNEKPKGICGTGMIDLVAELYKNGFINRYGKFKEKESDRIIFSPTPRFVVARAEETEFGKPITVSEKDINEFLLAKAAIKAGWMLLMRKMGIDESKLEKIYLAGSFGRYINIENAKLIGLLPNIPPEKIDYAGDTAVGGAKMALLSLDVRDEMEKVVQKVEYVELSVEKDFHSVFIRAIPI